MVDIVLDIVCGSQVGIRYVQLFWGYGYCGGYCMSWWILVWEMYLVDIVRRWLSHLHYPTQYPLLLIAV